MKDSKQEIQSKPEKKRIIGTPAGKTFWIASAALIAALGVGMIYSHYSLNANKKSRTLEPRRMELSKDEIDKMSHEAFLSRFLMWEKRMAPHFISYLNRDSITKEEYLIRLEKFRQEHPYQLAFNPDMKPEDLQAWQEQARTKFIELITGGEEFPEKVPLNLKQEPLDDLLHRLSKAPYRNYKIEQITYSTNTDRRIRAFIARPRDIKPGQKLPAILALPGHHGRPENMFMLDKSSIGGITKDPASYAYRIGHIVANQGYIVLAPDTGACPYMPDNENYQAPPQGWLIDGARVLDNIRSLDVLCSLPEVDTKRIGAYGFSLGGEESFYIGAVNERVKAAVVAGFFGHYDAQAACKCGVIPNFEDWLRISDLAALYLPNRSLITETGEHDGVENAINEGRDVRYLFNRFNANNNFLQIEMTGGHAFYGGPETLEKLNSVLRPDIRK